jgi:hypothetical protein
MSLILQIKQQSKLFVQQFQQLMVMVVHIGKEIHAKLLQDVVHILVVIQQIVLL